MTENHLSGIEQESMRLSAHDNFGKPVVHRSFSQISHQARQLRENIGLVTTHKERSAASELLTGAVDTLALTNELGHFQVQPQLHEDLNDASACQSVPEYIEKLRQRNIQNTIETNIRESGDRFESFMQRRMDSLWSSMRHNLLSSSMTAAPSTQLSPGVATDRPAPPGLLPAPSAANFSPIYPSPTGKATFTAAQQELSKVVCAYQRAVHAGSTYSIMDEVKPVLEQIAAEQAPAGPVSVSDLLAVLQSQSSAVHSVRCSRPGGSSVTQSQRAALTGSLQYMEAAYMKLMEQRVRSNRQTAMAGGSGSVPALIHGFISASSRATSGAMLVPPTRQAVAWQQVYHALRCNAMDAAIEAATAQALAFPGGHQVASELQGWLTVWHAGSRQLPAATAAEIERQAVGLVEGRELEKQGVPLARAAVLTLCVLSGSVKPLNAAIASDARSGQQALLPGSGVASIEDWMWLRCSVVRSQHDEGLGEEGALRQLQADVCAADPAHYTRDGARPVHYAVVLLLSLQFRRALNFLHVHPMCRAMRVAAPALALVVHDHGLTTLGGAGDLCGPAAGHAGLVNRIPATVVRQYARESYGLVTQQGWSRDSEAYLLMLRVAVDMQLACDSPAPTATSSAAADRDPSELLRDVLHEWALQTRDVGTELDQEKLRLFEPNAERRRRVLRAVAEDLRWEEPDMSGLLFALCGHHSKALEELNGALAMRIRSLAAASTLDQERSCVSDIQALGLRAQELKSSFSDYQLTSGREMSKTEMESLEDIVVRHWSGFLDLQRIARIVEAHRALQEASGSAAPASARVQAILREAAALQWLPVTSDDVPRCVRRVKVILQQYHRELLPLTLLAVAQALTRDAATKSDGHLAQEALERRAHVVQLAHLLNAEQGVDFVPQSVVRQLTEAP